MAIIFHKGDGRWLAQCLSGKRAELNFSPVAFKALGHPDMPCPADAVELQCLEPGRKWVAVFPEGCTHNGQAVPTRFRVLADGDLIASPQGERVFFSSEAEARVEAYAGPQPIECLRCTTPIEPGHPAVRCPNCAVLHHQLSERPCWTFSNMCAACKHPTTLDAEPCWTPGEL